MNDKKTSPLLRVWFYLTIMILFLIYKQLETIRWLLRDSDDYKITNAQIVSSDLAYHGTWWGWQLNIQYKYQVDGRMLQSNKTRGFGRKEQAEDYSQKYPDGKVILVYYRVSQPSISIFEPESIGASNFYLLGLSVFVSFVLLLYALKANTK
jgi:hypothetical protein